ncbi:TauD/TfdA family dioxygenase [Streptomyces sp. NPDC053048]|uniref:TauD/TfdA family dioxygenase n=1 Tax=Streptomyces sp. NPDC053048 TaxID=3365694 RepID=UPI0037CE3B8E
MSAYTDERRFHENTYTSKSRGYLHLHNDRPIRPFGQDPDCVALLSHRKAARGGASVLVDGWTVYRILREEPPAALNLLRTPHSVDRRHVTPPGGDPVVEGPVFEQVGGRVLLRCNTKRIETAAELTGRPLPPGRRAALDSLQWAQWVGSMARPLTRRARSHTLGSARGSRPLGGSRWLPDRTPRRPVRATGPSTRRACR